MIRWFCQLSCVSLLLLGSGLVLKGLLPCVLFPFVNFLVPSVGHVVTRYGYRWEGCIFIQSRDRNHPDLHLKDIDPSLTQDWVDGLRREVEAERMKPRTFSRRVAAISAMYRWVSDSFTVGGVRGGATRSLAGLNPTSKSRPLAALMNR